VLNVSDISEIKQQGIISFVQKGHG
jgi:hypothetical protein